MWKRIRRETGLIEHICEHGIGHPNEGSALWLAEALQEGEGDRTAAVEHAKSIWMVHGCDGCCGRDDFPGTLYHALRFAHGLIRGLQRQLKGE